MNILSWNVRGTAEADFKCNFQELVSSHQPDIVILMETRVNGERANRIIASLGFDYYTKVDAIGFAGAIWVL